MEDKINKQLLDDLKNLPKVSAPVNFEEGLWKKIYSEPEEHETLGQKIFSVNKFIPATATLALLIIIFFLLNNNSSDYEDPFMIEPPVRNDLITISNEESGVSDLIEQKQKADQQEWKSGNQTRELRKQSKSLPMNDSSNETTTSDQAEKSRYVSPQPMVLNDEVESNAIDKEELNFLKKSVSEQEKRQIMELRKKIRVSENPK